MISSKSQLLSKSRSSSSEDTGPGPPRRPFGLPRLVLVDGSLPGKPVDAAASMERVVSKAVQTDAQIPISLRSSMCLRLRRRGRSFIPASISTAVRIVSFVVVVLNDDLSLFLVPAVLIVQQRPCCCSCSCHTCQKHDIAGAFFHMAVFPG